MSDTSDLEHVLRLARKYGARTVRCGSIEVEMADDARPFYERLSDATGRPPYNHSRDDSEETPCAICAAMSHPLEAHEAIGAAAGRPTDDELLMWSAPQPSEEGRSHDERPDE
jgi:hypothetical protein